MRVAVIDHMGNFGGGSRFIMNLVPSLRKIAPDTHITYFGNSLSVEREQLTPVFTRSDIQVENLRSLSLSNHLTRLAPWFGKGVRQLQFTLSDKLPFVPPLISGDTKKEIEKTVKNYDVAYFPWPFFIGLPDLDCPIVATVHDFNFKYFFGSQTFTAAQMNQLESQLPDWLEKATPIVSSFFMKTEMEKYYPEFATKANVVHLAPLCGDELIATATAQKIIAKLNIQPPYIIYPTNTCAHKNILSLISALSLLRERGFGIKLVLTGNGTESLSGRATPTGIEKGLQPQNIIGLGYVTNRQMDSLIRCAAALVSTSLYEAGNGPGVDAWALGVPVAMSDIPCFTEHLDHQKVQAELFDPLNPSDIADKIAKILAIPELAESMVKNSQNAIQKMNWSSVAQKYLAIFEKAANGKSNEY